MTIKAIETIRQEFLDVHTDGYLPINPNHQFLREKMTRVAATLERCNMTLHFRRTPEFNFYFGEIPGKKPFIPLSFSDGLYLHVKHSLKQKDFVWPIKDPVTNTYFVANTVLRTSTIKNSSEYFKKLGSNRDTNTVQEQVLEALWPYKEKIKGVCSKEIFEKIAHFFIDPQPFSPPPLVILPNIFSSFGIPMSSSRQPFFLHAPSFFGNFPSTPLLGVPEAVYTESPTNKKVEALRHQYLEGTLGVIKKDILLEDINAIGKLLYKCDMTLYLQIFRGGSSFYYGKIPGQDALIEIPWQEGNLLKLQAARQEAKKEGLIWPIRNQKTKTYFVANITLETLTAPSIQEYVENLLNDRPSHILSPTLFSHQSKIIFDALLPYAKQIQEACDQHTYERITTICPTYPRPK